MWERLHGYHSIENADYFSKMNAIFWKGITHILEIAITSDPERLKFKNASVKYIFKIYSGLFRDFLLLTLTIYVRKVLNYFHLNITFT